MSSTRLVCLALALVFLAVGCGKKKAPVSQQPVTPVAVQDTTKKDSADIFNEFFDDKKAKEQPAAATFSGNFAEDGAYVVQVSCVGSKAVADEHQAKLSGKGWPAYVAEVNGPTPELTGTYYRVRVGGFNTVSEAKSFGDVVSTEGYEYWVDNRSNDNVGLQSSGMGGTPSSSDYSGGTSSSTATTDGSTGSWGSTSSSTTGTSTTSSGAGATTTSSDAGTSSWGSSTTPSTGDAGTSTTTTTTTSTGSDWGAGSSTSGTSSTGTGTTSGTSSSTTPTTTTTTTTTTPSTGTSSGTGGTTSGGTRTDEWGSEW